MRQNEIYNRMLAFWNNTLYRITLISLSACAANDRKKGREKRIASLLFL